MIRLRFGFACLLFTVLSLRSVGSYAQTSSGAVSNTQNPVATKKVTTSALPKPTWLKDLSLSLGVSTFLGTGSFTPGTYQNHYVGQSFDLNASYSLAHGFSVYAMWGFDVEYTQPDNDVGRRFFARDVTLGTTWALPFASLKKILNLSVGLNIDLPTSLAAQIATRILSLGGNISLSRTFGPFSISYSFSFAHNFHRYTTPIFNQANAELPSILVRQETRDQLSVAPTEVPIPGAYNTPWQISNTLSLGLKLPQNFSLGLSFGIFNQFRYAAPDDKYTPNIPTSQGVVKADIIGRSDLTMANIYVAWSPLPYLAISLGAFSIQTPLRADNQGLRVPFFNFVTPNDNYTTFYLRLTGSY